uniref:Pentatricopeptide repeat-containing protein n=1 Tax=Chenopodium quinoa TaxID=63459 RepID=A0A803KNP5_CHEQI
MLEGMTTSGVIPDIVTYNFLIDGLYQVSDLIKQWKSCLNSELRGFLCGNDVQKASEFFRIMNSKGLAPDACTTLLLHHLLAACYVYLFKVL